MPAKRKPTAVPQPVPGLNPAARLLTVKGAAEYLSTTVWFIRSQVWAGNLPRLTLGKRLLFERSDLDRFVERMKAESVA